MYYKKRKNFSVSQLLFYVNFTTNTLYCTNIIFLTSYVNITEVKGSIFACNFIISGNNPALSYSYICSVALNALSFIVFRSS